MDEKTFLEMYADLDRSLRQECDEMVERGELTREEADFRWYMVRDELLWGMEDLD